jgi:PST family polysaccharide transporter
VKRLFKITALLTSSSALEILINIIKTKGVAVLLGPAGVGLMGLFQSVLNLLRNLTGVFAGAGLVQSVAELDPGQLSQLHNSLLRYILRTSLVLSVLIALFSQPLARFFFDDSSRYWQLLGFALMTPVVFLATFWRSWLNGLRHITQLARLKIMAAVVTAISTLLLVLLLGLNGVYLAVLLYPVPMAVLAYRFLRPTVLKTPSGQHQPAVAGSSTRDILRKILATGKTLFLSSLLFTAAVLVVKGLINRRLGTESLGLFQASWTVSMVYIELVLVALGMDFFPRLSRHCQDHKATKALIDQQLTFSLMIATPVILGLMLTSPWLLRWLYSRDFVAAIQVLHWQLVGDFFKVPAWILGYVLIAQRQLLHSLLIQCLWVCLFVAGSLWGMTRYGLSATGMAFAVAYALAATVSYVMVVRLLSYRPSTTTRRAFFMVLVAAIIALCSRVWPAQGRSLLALSFTASTALSFFWLWTQWHQPDQTPRKNKPPAGKTSHGKS